jgi:Tol biopolymer transport system component
LAVSADGGEPLNITTLAEGEFSHRLPQFLPDGDWLILTVMKGMTDWEGVQVIAHSLETDERKVLIEKAADARYVPTGHLIFARLGILMAVPFDPTDLEVTGGPVGVLEGVKQAVNARNPTYETGAAQFTISASGSLVYVPGGIFPDMEANLIWVDRNGMAEPLAAPPAPYLTPRLSPDGKRIVYFTMSLKSDLWIYDISRATTTRLPVEQGLFPFPSPVWTPDGASITFSSDTAGVSNIYRIPADGSGPAEQLTAVGPALPASWSPDGQVLAFLYGEDEDEIWVLPLDGEPRPFFPSSFVEWYPTFSPDGRWLAYSSNQSERMEVYVTPFPGPGPRHQISKNFGVAPAWSPNGGELFYLGGVRDGEGWRGTMMSVDITTEPKFAAGRPRELFTYSYGTTYPVRGYDVAPDGRRFLVVREESQPEELVTQIHVVLNWFEELKRLVPTN